MIDDLWVTVITQKQHERTCNYWYLVTSHAMSHTAFTTKRGLMRWMKERNLKLSAPLTKPGTLSSQRIIGKYNRVMHLDPAIFEKLNTVIKTREMDNADYTLAKITEEDGIRTVNVMNCNLPRKIYEYWASNKMMR